MACDRRETVSLSLQRSHAGPRCPAETARAMTVCGLVYQGYPHPAATTKRCLWSMQETSRYRSFGVAPCSRPLPRMPLADAYSLITVRTCVMLPTADELR